MTAHSIDFLMQKSLQLQQVGRLSEARATLRKILKQSPLHAEALYLTAMTYLRAQEHEKGADYLRRVLALQPNNTEAYYNLGVALSKTLQYAEAMSNLRRALELNPRYWKAHVRLADVLQRSGHLEESRTHYEQALALRENCSDALVGLGVLYGAMGKLQEAVLAYRQALVFDPRHADAYNNLGFALGALRRFTEAVEAFRYALKIRPDYVDAYVGLARVLVNLDRREEALGNYQRAYEVRQDAECAYELGRLLQEMKLFLAAKEWYRRALETQPKHFNALDGLGLVLGDLRRHDDAIKIFKRMLAIAPEDITARVNLGNAYYECRRFDEALAVYHEALALEPDNVAAHNGLGSVLVEIGRIDDAMASFNRALEINPKYVGAIYNRGVAFERLLRYDEAMSEYDRCEGVDPGFAEAGWNRSLVLLLHGRFQEGWPGYESRTRLQSASQVPEVSCPRWIGTQRLAGKKLLICTEEGYGDNIQMVRYIRLLEACGAECLIQCRQPLAGLMARSFPNTRVITPDALPEDMDFHIPVMSLPGAMKTFTEADIPAEVPYLTANPERLAHWSESTDKAVGLVWRGNPKHANDHNRSSRLVDFLPLIDRHPHIRFVTLQKELTPEERGLLENRTNILVLDEELTDFDESAAVIGNLRLLISIDSAPAHLAGALGIPVWILLPFHGEWRWLRDRDDSPWYPTARLFRQTAFGDWQGVIKKVDTQLKQLGETSNA
jgi:tetratricopeptide (TPR) repeat protein